MRPKIKLEGFAELESALAEFPRATQKAVLKRAGMKAMKRVEDKMRQNAPKDENDLADSIDTQVQKAKRVSRTRYARTDTIEIATGPTGREEGGNPAWQEFGTVKMAPNPYARPAADSEGPAVIADVKEDLAVEVRKTADRIAKRAAKKR